MTVSTTLNYVSYPGDGIATNFPFSFPVFDQTHLFVYYQDNVTKVLTLLALGADYNATGIGSSTGGAVVTTVAPPNTVRLVIARIVPFTQDLSVLNEGGFYPENVEKALDTEEMAIQQNAERIARSVRGQIMEVWPDLPPAPQRAGQILAFTNDAVATPTIDATHSLLAALLDLIIQGGTGISIAPGTNTITITNTAPFIPQDCWLLESGTAGVGSTGDAEFIRDTIGVALQAVGAVVTVDDPADTITIDLSQDVTAEIIRDVVAATLTAGTLLTKSVDDPGNTTTLNVDTAAVDERARDAVGAALVGGLGISVTVDDPGDHITIDGIPDILTVASAATVTPTFSYNQVNITAQGVNLTLANPTGTAIDGHGILVRIKDDGTSRTITYGTKYRTFNDALPAATTVGKTLYLGIIYNLADDKWDVLGVRLQA